MPKDTCNYRRMRDEALYAAFKRALADDPRLTENEALRIALREKQPRLWLSFYGAYRIVLEIAKGKDKPQKHLARDGVVESIRRKYLRLRSHRTFKNSSSLFITSFIITEPADGFYLSRSYAKRIIWKMRKQKQSLWRRPRTI